MTAKLFFEAICKFILGVVMIGLLLFLPAGTLHYPQGWLFMGLLFIPMFLAGLVMMAKDPNLLRSRLKAKEEQKEQQLVVKLSGLMFLCGFVLAGLTHRFGWPTLPKWAVITASAVFLLSYALYAEVLRENAYLSRTIEVQEGQTVIDTGLYSIVRHPMYSVTLLLFLSMPLVLGAPLAFPVFLFYPFLIAKRIENEEQVLEAELPGYIEYKKKVKYRLLPGLW